MNGKRVIGSLSHSPAMHTSGQVGSLARRENKQVPSTGRSCLGHEIGLPHHALCKLPCSVPNSFRLSSDWRATLKVKSPWPDIVYPQGTYSTWIISGKH
jgi:hypothetical protein